MFSKFAILFLVAALGVAVQAHGYHDQPIVGNDVEKYLKELEEKVDAAIAKGQEKLNEAKAAVDAAAQSVQTEAKSLMQSTEDEFKKELDELKAKAKKANVNIDDCLGADEDTLVNLPTTGTNQMVQCVQAKIDKAFQYAQDALNKMQSAVDDVANLKQEIKDCGHGLKAVKCLAKLAIKIEQEITTLPTKIEADAAATALIITKVKDEIKECANSAVNKVESDGKTVLERISVCVAQKIIT